ncbi:MAG: GAF domain-containing protein, partial [Pseudomonadota bacterium]
IHPDAALGKTDYDFFPKELADKHIADDRRIMESGLTEDFEECYIQDGDEVIVNKVKTPIKDKKGNVIGILVMFWDVTKYKRAEMKATRQAKVLEAINMVFQEAIAAETVEELGRRCLHIAEELTGSRFGFIGEVNSRGRFDTLALNDPGWSSCRMPQSQAAVLIKDMETRGIWGKVIKDGKSLITNDPASHPDRIGLPDGHPELTSFLGVPLNQKGRTVGLIALGNKESGYGAMDQEAMEPLSVAVMQALNFKKMQEEQNRTAETIARQSREIMELSTPVIQVWEGIIAAPLIGTLDSDRTQLFMERFLNSIVETKSSVAMVDITGVPTVDTQTAQHLIEAITAAKLLGAHVILTGVRPSIAQTLVHLGIDLSEIETQASLVGGLRIALNKLDLTVTRKDQVNREKVNAD